MNIAYICRTCAEPIPDGQGHLSVDTTSALNALTYAEREIRKSALEDGVLDPPPKTRSFSDLYDEIMAGPPHPGWIPTHNGCDTGIGPTYDLPVEKIRSAEALLDGVVRPPS